MRRRISSGEPGWPPRAGGLAAPGGCLPRRVRSAAKPGIRSLSLEPVPELDMLSVNPDGRIARDPLPLVWQTMATDAR